MLVRVDGSEFVDGIRSFDECSLSAVEARCLFVWLEAELSEDAVVDVADWAIAARSTSLDEINDEHGTEFESFDDLQDRISWDHLDGTATAAIDCGDSIVMVGVI